MASVIHVIGGSFLFLIYALRYSDALRLPFILIFIFIALDAVANRWHYAIDLPAGMLLAAFASWIAHKVVTATTAKREVAADRPGGRWLTRCRGTTGMACT